VTQLSPPTTRKVTNRWPWISGSAAVLLAVALGFLIALRTTPDAFDARWMAEVIGFRGPFLDVVALVFNYLGGGWVAVFLIPIGGALLLWRLRGRWTAIYFVAATALSGLVVQILKNAFGRARPDDFLLQIGSPSFPSGHTANAATLAIALGLLVGRWWVWMIGVVYMIAMALSRTYLGVHWATDTLGGMLVGAGVGFILWAPLASRIKKEWTVKHPVEAVEQTETHQLKKGGTQT
jgi:membrane-associated phospholipid phosphatase